MLPRLPVKEDITDTMRERLVGLLIALTAVPAPAQDARLIAADPPPAELPYEFSQINAVFELRDGRVIVLDRLEGNVRLADLKTGLSSMLGRLGEGPGEYRMAHALIPLGGDSVGVVDGAQRRVLVITSSGSVGGFVSPMASHPTTRALIEVRTGDGLGWLYGSDSPVQRNAGGTLQFSDSSPILRWQPKTETAKIIVRYYNPPPPGASIIAPGYVVHSPGVVPALFPVTMWTVGPDSRVAVVSGSPYRVHFMEADGNRRTGPVIPFAKVAVNDSVKNAYQSDLARPQIVVLYEKGGVATTTTRAVPPMIKITNWAAEVPPFRGDAFVAFDARGILWIQRTTFGREGGRYDLIGFDGALVDRVRLPEGHRVVGFGRGVMYVVRRDADDLEFLQRRPMPR